MKTGLVRTMAHTPKAVRRIVPLLRHELRSASSCNLYSAEHTSRSRYVMANAHTSYLGISSSAFFRGAA